MEKLLLPTQAKPRTTYKCRNRNSTIVENQQIDEPVPEDNDLEQIVEDLKEANEKQQSDIAMLNKKVKECSFSVQQFKSNDSDFEFYTGFCDMVHFRHFITIFAQHVRGCSILVLVTVVTVRRNVDLRDCFHLRKNFFCALCSLDWACWKGT